MMRLMATILVAVLPFLILGATGDRTLKKRDNFEIQIQTVQTNDVLQWFCQESPFAAWLSFCQNSSANNSGISTTTIVPPEVGSTTIVNPSTTTPVTASTTESASALERAHWCRFSNGTYVARGFTFMHTACDICQCTQSRLIRCATLQCMPTYCIDNSVPSIRPGQCCAQCAYEVNSTQCVQSGITFPQGTIVKSTSDKVNCWCQQGAIECRKIGISVFSGLDLWGDGTAVYVIIVFVFFVLIVGTLCCGGCSLLYYYYYYYYNQRSAEQAYWENAGWQPMGDEEEQVADANAEKKQAEAEQGQVGSNQPAVFSEEYVPPPYALYNGAYENEQANKEQKFM